MSETQPQPEDVSGELDTSYHKWRFEKLYASMSPAWQRNTDRRRRVWAIQRDVYRWCPWLHWPVLSLMTGFWMTLFDEGPYQLMKPRWGALTFGYLNDGYKPTVWHTIQNVLWPRGRFSGIYPSGAPSSRRQAEEWEAKWAAERIQREASWPEPNLR